MQEMNGTEHRELEYEYESWGETICKGMDTDRRL